MSLVKVIKKDSTVLIDYTMYLEDGSIADSTIDEGKPAIFKMGVGHISEAFEEQLLGLQAGDETRVDLTPEHAFGVPMEENIYTVPASRFENLDKLEVGSIVAFEQKDGEEIPGIIRSITEGLIIVDFNHPLAGHKVSFVVKIVEVDPPKEVDH